MNTVWEAPQLECASDVAGALLAAGADEPVYAQLAGTNRVFVVTRVNVAERQGETVIIMQLREVSA